MRKWFTALLALALCVALAAPAFAQAAGPSESGHPENRFTDEQKETIKSKVEEVKALLAQLAELRAAAREQAEANKALWEQLKDQYGDGAFQAVRDKRAELRAFAESTIRPIMEQVRALREQLRNTQDPEQAAAIRAELEALRTESQSALEQFNALKSELEQMMEQVRPVREELKELREALQPLRQEMRDLLGELRALHEEGRAARAELRSAFESGQFGQVISTLEQIIQIEKKALKLGEQVLEVQQEIGQVLQDALDG